MTNNTVTIPTSVVLKLRDNLAKWTKEATHVNLYKIRDVTEASLLAIIEALNEILAANNAAATIQPAVTSPAPVPTPTVVATVPPAMTGQVKLTPQQVLEVLAKVGINAEITEPTGMGT